MTPDDYCKPLGNDILLGLYDGGSIGNNSCRELTMKKGPWTPEEDAILIEYIEKYGQRNWSTIQKNSGLGRCAKSCRLRWANHLRPNLKKGPLTLEEEEIIIKMHAKHGNKWARMAAKLPGRTDNEIKNYWHSRTKRCLKQGLPLYPDGIEGKQSPEYYLNNCNNSSNNNYSPDHRPTPNTSTNQSPLSPSTPQSQFQFSSPHQHCLPSLHHLASPNSISSPHLSLVPQRSPKHQSPKTSTNQSPLSPSTPQSQFQFSSPHQHCLPLLHHLASPNNISSPPLSLVPQRSPKHQSTLSLIDPSTIAFTPLRPPPILSSPPSRFNRFQSTSSELSLPLSPTPLPSSLLVHSSPITSLPLSSSLGFSSSPILQTQYKPNRILTPPSSFTLESELPSSQLSPVTALKSTVGTKVELPSSQTSTTAGLKSSINAIISLHREKTKSKSSSLDALLGPRRAKTKNNSGLLDGLLREVQKRGNNGLLDPLLVKGQARAGDKILKRQDLLEKSLRREGLLSKRLNTKDIWGNSSKRENSVSESLKPKDLFSKSLQTESLLTEKLREGSLNERSKKVDLLSESSMREGLLSESLKTEALLGESWMREGLLSESSKTEGLLYKSLIGGPLGDESSRGGLLDSQEQNQVSDRFGLVPIHSPTTPQLGSGGLCDELSSVHSSAGEKAVEEPDKYQIDTMPEEMSSLLNFFPTLDQVPQWYWNGQDIISEQSAGDVDVTLGLDTQKHMDFDFISF